MIDLCRQSSICPGKTQPAAAFGGPDKQEVEALEIAGAYPVRNIVEGRLPEGLYCFWVGITGIILDPAGCLVRADTRAFHKVIGTDRLPEAGTPLPDPESPEKIDHVGGQACVQAQLAVPGRTIPCTGTE